MSIKYSQITDKIADEMRNAKFVSSRDSQIKRAVNMALDDINFGNLGDDPRKIEQEIGYDFQKRIAAVTFVTTTDTYPFSDLSIDDDGFKFSSDLRINSDEDRIFVQVEPDRFHRRTGRFQTTENIYTIEWEDGTQNLLINYESADTLDFVYFDNDMVLNSSTRQAHFSDVKDEGHQNETWLGPDRYYMAIVFLASANLMKGQKGLKDGDYLDLLTRGREILNRMIQSIGQIKEKPRKRPRVRSEWNLSEPRRDSRRW